MSDALWGTAMTTRRLADVARPARGRRVDRLVLFAIVPPDEMDAASRQLIDAVSVAAGPTRSGPVLVSISTTLDGVARVLSSPLTLSVPTRRLYVVQETFRSIRGAVLITGHCEVLWTQTSGQVRCS